MSDIRKIQGKYYDFDPKNKSFLQTAHELKQLGIKNYYFPLLINNPRIADIDPFKPNITRQEMEALLHELKGNLWFFARSVVKLRTDLGIVDFGLHRGLAAAMWCFSRNQDCCLCEPRQTWKTTGLIGSAINWAFQLSQNLNIHFFGKDTENTKRNLASIKDDISLLPQWLQFTRYQDTDGKIKKTRQSTEIIENRLMHNKIVMHPKPTSLSHAQGMARGASAAIIYFDEIEHTPFFDELLSNSAPAFKVASDNAKAAGKPACRVFSCTPGNLDTREGRTSLPIIKSMIPFTEKIYDMTPEELALYKSAYVEEYHSDESITNTREVVDIFYAEFQYYQVRKTYQWVLEQYKLSGDKMAIRREVLLQRIRGSSDSPISPEDIEYLISNMVKAKNDLIINGKWRFLLYDHEQSCQFDGTPKLLDENIPYLVGIDTASGKGGDNIAITLVNPFNLQIAAEFKNPYISGTDLCRLLITLVNDYIPEAVLIIEQNNMGIYLIQMIYEQTSISRNLYWNKKADPMKSIVVENPSDRELQIAAEKWKMFGTTVSEKTRNAMFELLFKHIRECKELLNTEYLVDDICKLIRTSTGRIQAGQGEHDDSLFAYLHAIYVWYTGDNLPLFGINIQEHPVLGPVEKDLEGNLIEKDNLSPFFSTENITFEQAVIEDTIRMENEIKEMVENNPTIYDPVYSRPSISILNDSTNINPNFFDDVNI